MCLITEQIKPTLLKEDMVVFKSLIDKGTYASAPLFDFDYEFDQLYEVEMKIDNIFESYADNKVEKAYLLNFCGKGKEREEYLKKYTHVHDGFHSFTIPDRMIFSNTEIFQCTIPAGSLVLEDKTGLIVSNKIIIHSKILDTGFGFISGISTT